MIFLRVAKTVMETVRGATGARGFFVQPVPCSSNAPAVFTAYLSRINRTQFDWLIEASINCSRGPIQLSTAAISGGTT
jgi:hypothetical protein